MSQENIEISVKTRDLGKSETRRLRREKWTPGVVYGTSLKDGLNFCAEEKFIQKFASHRYENTFFTLKSDDKKLNGLKILIKDCQRNPVNRRPTHVDFWAVEMNRAIRVPVELKFVGKAKGLQEGGVLQPLVRDLEVECLPSDIPEFIEVDVSELGVHESLHLSEITLPSKVKPTSTEDIGVVTVAVVKEESLETTASEESAEPEVIKKGKAEEEGKEKADEKA